MSNIELQNRCAALVKQLVDIKNMAYVEGLHLTFEVQLDDSEGRSLVSVSMQHHGTWTEDQQKDFDSHFSA